MTEGIPSCGEAEVLKLSDAPPWQVILQWAAPNASESVQVIAFDQSLRADWLSRVNVIPDDDKQ